jgi:hypothetical protein
VIEYTTYDQNDADETAALLVGRRIVAAEMGVFKRPDVRTWSSDPATGKLTLDDGTEILVVPHEGGCACSAGDYALTALATVDNVITSVRLAVEDADRDQWGEGDQSYRIYVVADAVEVNAVQIDGSDGNGYYGTGYQLIVVKP